MVCLFMMTHIKSNLNTPRISKGGEEFVYPSPPDRLKLFTKHRFVDRPITPAVAYLEHMLTKTSLTTQKATHNDIEELGQQVHEDITYKHEWEKAIAVKEAIKRTQEIEHKKQKNMLQEVLIKAKEEKLEALMKQEMYYEQLAARTVRGRDQLEKEKLEQMVVKKEKEKEEALEKQWEKAEKLKREAIERSLSEQHKRMRASAALEREIAIAKALRVARERFAVKLDKEIEKVKELCREIALQNTAREKELHEVEIQRLNERIATLTKDSEKRFEKQKHAERNFVGIESDYAYLLDLHPLTPCRSDYLVTSRKFLHGVERGRRTAHAQTSLISFDQKSVSAQTEVQMIARP